MTLPELPDTLFGGGAGSRGGNAEAPPAAVTDAAAVGLAAAAPASVPLAEFLAAIPTTEPPLSPVPLPPPQATNTKGTHTAAHLNSGRSRGALRIMGPPANESFFLIKGLRAMYQQVLISRPFLRAYCGRGCLSHVFDRDRAQWHHLDHLRSDRCRPWCWKPLHAGASHGVAVSGHALESMAAAGVVQW